MSDETTTKKSLILNALAQPGGSDLSNAEIAKAVGCFSNLVKSVRAEVETEQLREENQRLKAELAAQQEAVAAPAVKPAPRKSRRVKVEFYPLFNEG